MISVTRPSTLGKKASSVENVEKLLQIGLFCINTMNQTIRYSFLGLQGKDMSTCMKTQSVLSAVFAVRSSQENLNLGSTRPNFIQLLCFKKTVRSRQKKMNQREHWTSVPNARLSSRGPASWHSTCWSIRVWNHTNVTSVKRHLHGRPTCSCTSEPTRERSHTLALVVGGVSPTSQHLEDIAEHTQGNVRTVAACVEEHLRRRAPFTITRRLAKGKGWTLQMAKLRNWKISACLIFNQSMRILNVIYLKSITNICSPKKAFSQV